MKISARVGLVLILIALFGSGCVSKPAEEQVTELSDSTLSDFNGHAPDSQSIPLRPFGDVPTTIAGFPSSANLLYVPSSTNVVTVRNAYAHVGRARFNYAKETKICIDRWIEEQPSQYNIKAEFDTPTNERKYIVSFTLSGLGSGLSLLNPNYREIHRIDVLYFMQPPPNDYHVYASVSLVSNKFAYWQFGQAGAPEYDRYSGLAWLETESLRLLANKLALALEGCVGKI